MQFTELQALLDQHTTGDTLTLAAADLGRGPAAALIAGWLDDKTLTITGLHREDHPDSRTVVVGGELSALGITGAQVTGIEFGLDPVDQDPALFIPLTAPAGWTLATSFPDTEGSDLAGLAFGARPPELLLTSVARPARDGRPALGRGLTFHAPEVQDPAPLGSLIALVRPSQGSLSLTGPVQLRPVGDKVVTDIALRSVPEPSGEFGGDFLLWAGSRGDGPPLTYGLRLAADLVLAQGVGVAVSAAVPVAGNEIVLTVDALPGSDVGTGVVEGWYGTGAAVQQLTSQGFTLGDAVRLTELSVTIDLTKISQGPAKALTAVTVKAGAKPEVSWPIAGDDLAVTGVGARLTVTAPLQPGRSATVTGFGDFAVTGTVVLHASAAIPPGSFQLTLDEETPAQLKDVIRHFLPKADLSGVPDLTLKKFDGTAVPTKGEYEVSAAVATEWHIDIGASRLQLDEASLELEREKEQAEGEARKGGKHRGARKSWRKARAEAAERRTAALTSEAAGAGAAAAKTTGTLAAKATLGPAGHDGAIAFDAAWHLPGTFELGGTFPEIDLTALLKALACDADVPLPGGLPAVELLNTAVKLRLGGARVGEPAEGKGYELAVGSTVTFGGADALTFVGKAAKGGDPGTLFAAAFWQDGWTWAPNQVQGWSEALGILGDITFAKSGLAVCSADGVALDAGSPPDTLPATLDKGLTFFTEIGFTGPLEPLKALFEGAATGVHLQAVLASPVRNSVFRASIAEQKVRAGFGGIEVEIQPAQLRITLKTSWNFTVPAMGSSPETLLQFVAGGTVSREGFSLFLTLKPADAALGTIAGQLAPGQYAFALEGPGHKALSAVPVTGADGRIVYDAARQLSDSAAPQPGPAWKNAFGIEGFDIEAFWAQIGSGTSGLTLGMGGSIRVGEAGLELDIVGGMEPEPFVTVFRFALTTADKDKGVSLWDILAVVFTPPEALVFLKKIVLHELMFCAVTVPGGWTSPLGEHWDQGYRGKGNIDFFGNNWRFEVAVGNDGVYADSTIARPLIIGEVFSLSNSDGTTGPRYLLDTRGIKDGHLPSKILYLSGKVALLGLSVAVEAELGTDGFAFTLEAHLLDILQSQISCTLDTGSGLHAGASVGLDFSVDLPRGVLLGGIPIAGGTLVGIKAHGGFDLKIDGSGANLRLTAGCEAWLAGVRLVGFDLDLTFGVRKWDDIVGYLQDHPEELFASLGQGIWDSMKDCATTKAAELT
ncbi:hypothetical protein Q3V23_03140 [Streptomyces sp. VNUA116]|uniref:hypothetical protein n=1 Tax=Streptomyces sp. VNUA116 TaxID=3062449 RepID=UPI0026759D0C|nr:hypothetical protein [Streptomyces sp. VNUA116]WKU43149.1 hypothetical protein Q3V23_03140 [Streptomyces sp. VNUA116]